MATILAHPTLLFSPGSIELFQRRTGLVVVPAGRVAVAIPSLIQRRLAQPTAARIQPDYTGPEAA